MAAGELKQSQIKMTPPVFEFPLFYNQRLPDQVGVATKKRRLCVRFFCPADVNAIARAVYLWTVSKSEATIPVDSS
jgi:hypothetical protein